MGPVRVAKLLGVMHDYGEPRPANTQHQTARGASAADSAAHLNAISTEIERARKAYYGTDPDEGISDAEYDVLMQQLRDALSDHGSRKGRAVKRAQALLSTVGVAPASITTEHKRKKHQLEDNGNADVITGSTDAAAEKGATKRPKRKGLADSPAAIQTVAHSPARGGRLLSLASVHSAQELRTWWQRSVEPTVGDTASIVVEPKVDGLTLRLTYESGQLVEAATRGDGDVGESVLHATPHIVGIPRQVARDAHLQHFSVRGEVYIGPADFVALNEQRRAAGEAPFATARNAAAGSLRVLHSSIARRGLRFAAFELIPTPSEYLAAAEQAEMREVPDHWDALKQLEDMRFGTVLQNATPVNGLDDAIKQGDMLLQTRDALPYETDGCVIKLRNIADQKRLGSVGADPKYAVAWKPPPQAAISILQEIKCNVARTGVLVPVASLAPTQIAGVTIRHASLHNTSHVATLDLRIGDTVLVERRGDVIPQVTRVLHGKRPKRAAAWQPPKKCPACGSKLVLRTQERTTASNSGAARKGKKGVAGVEMVICANDACSARRGRQLRHFVSTCVKGVGEKTMEDFVTHGLCNVPTDLYGLKDQQDKLLALPRYGKKKVQNLLRAIEESKRGSAALLLSALGIPGVGKEMATVLIDRFGSIAALQEADTDVLMEIDGIADTSATAIRLWFSDPAHAQLAKDLAAVWGVSTSPADSSTESTRASDPRATIPGPGQWSLDLGVVTLRAGSKLVMTGGLADVPRPTIQEWCKAHGLKLVGSVSRRVDCLVSASGPPGTTPSSKYENALAAGLPIVEDDEHLAKLSQTILAWLVLA